MEIACKVSWAAMAELETVAGASVEERETEIEGFRLVKSHLEARTAFEAFAAAFAAWSIAAVFAVVAP